MKAILFDFDGTLADTLPNIYHSFKSIFKTYDQSNFSSEEIMKMFGPPETEIIDLHLQHEDKESAKEDYYHEYEKNHSLYVKRNEEITEVLHTLKDNGVKLGVVTGKSKRSLGLSLKELGMENIFSVMITGNDVKNPKPDPEGIEMAIKKLNLKKTDAIYIGDSDSDIEAGNRAEITAYAAQWLPNFETAEYDHQPKERIRSVSEFKDIIQEAN
ncbi:HAD family hydrolase [Metabacillus sp. RGM 3146]|uniref:HAD family hydrolase n=1 Tax=Metabacillus sp. RGM 3146 TaxID=3401092 RepID=UPI003B9BD104